MEKKGKKKKGKKKGKKHGGDPRRHFCFNFQSPGKSATGGNYKEEREKKKKERKRKKKGKTAGSENSCTIN